MTVKGNGEKRKIRTRRKTVAAASHAVLLPMALVSGRMMKEFGKLPSADEVRRFRHLSNYADGCFVNAEVLEPPRAGGSGLPWRNILLSDVNDPQVALPQVKLDRNSFSAVRDDFSVIWLGHAMLMIELGGVRILTDPVFGNAAPLPGLVRRHAAAPLSRKELPPVDLILLTHDHYDHLEYATIRSLRGESTPLIAPLGVGARLRGWGIAAARIHELNWNESIERNGIKITAVTSRHFSGRTLGTRNRTLWAAYVLETPRHRMFLGCDGGYGRHFRAIGQQYGPFDLVALEIDAWNDSWPSNHMFPEQVPLACRDLNGKLLLPIHWGVFDLANHPWNASIRAVVREAEKHGVPLTTPQMGQKIIPGITPTGPWWELPLSS